VARGFVFLPCAPFCIAHAQVPWLIGLTGVLLVAVGALPYAGGWNDGSRLAAVESLVEQHTLAIDDSIFCRPPPDTLDRGCPPYPADAPDLLAKGTRDKLLIQGHFYSDKPPVITALMAALYQAAKWLGLPSAASRPDLFCWVLTVGTAGLAYVLSVLSLHRLGRLLGLPEGLRLVWVASFSLATVALTYTRQVNNHVLLLGVVAGACLQLVYLAREATAGEVSRLRLVGLGALAGLGYNLDLGAGPPLLAGMLALVAYRCRKSVPVLVFLLAACPWVVACHACNYAISGVWKPMNMVPEYSAWPGCPFTPENMTGFSRHGPLQLPIYLLALLFGRRGFFTHNLPLFLVFPALVTLARRAERFRPELVFALGWCSVTWLLYGVLSNNYSGACCSIRWFVPFLAPCYFLLAIHLRECPRHQQDFLVLSLWGAVLAVALWWQGPWAVGPSGLLWPIVGAALLSWLVCRRRRPATSHAPAAVPARRPLAA
jgi:hypothetical protein